jgi:hypothetical protein
MAKTFLATFTSASMFRGFQYYHEGSDAQHNGSMRLIELKNITGLVGIESVGP